MIRVSGLNTKWFWYSLLCVIFWAGWILFAKLGTNQGVPALPMQFIFPFGALPVVFLLFLGKPLKFERSAKGILYGTANGVLSAIGGLALFAALNPVHQWNTSMISAVTALYPMITVLLAVTVLREKLTGVQVVGLGFAAVAIVIFSL